MFTFFLFCGSRRAQEWPDRRE